jgi:hypothetical protein
MAKLGEEIESKRSKTPTQAHKASGLRKSAGTLEKIPGLLGFRLFCLWNAFGLHDVRFQVGKAGDLPETEFLSDVEAREVFFHRWARRTERGFFANAASSWARAKALATPFP